MNTEESRKEFESWYWVNYGKFERDMPNVIFAIEDNEYIYLGPRIAYDSWQAARSKKIKLPDLSDFMDTNYSWDGENETASDYFMEESCRKAIIAAIHEAGFEVENVSNKPE